jgi:hypothetical protein
MAQLAVCQLRLANARPLVWPRCLPPNRIHSAGKQLGLSADSVILLIGTEGATDADIYAELTAAGQS